MKFNTYEEFIDWLKTDPTVELRRQVFDTIPIDWNMRFLREASEDNEAKDFQMPKRKLYGPKVRAVEEIKRLRLQK